MKDNFRRANFLKWIDTDLARIAMIVGFTVDIISLIQLVFVFRLFVESSANSAFSKGLGSNVSFIIWGNPIIRGVTFVIIILSIIYFPYTFYKNKKSEFLRSNSKSLALLDNPFRDHIRALFDEGFYTNTTIDQLTFFESVYFSLMFFPPLIFLWLRVFYVNNPGLLWIAIFYYLVSLILTRFLYWGRGIKDSIWFTSTILFPIFAGFLLMGDSNLILVMLISVVVAISSPYLFFTLITWLAKYLTEKVGGKLFPDTYDQIKISDWIDKTERKIKEDSLSTVEKLIKQGDLERNIYPEKALSPYSRAIEKAPDNFDVLERRGNILLKLARNDEALKDLEKAFSFADTKKRKVSIGISLIEAMCKLGDFERIQAFVRLQIDLQNDAEFYNGAADKLYESRNYKLAKEFIDQAVAIAPDSNIYLTRAKIHLMLTQHDRALVDVERGLEILNDEQKGWRSSYLSRYSDNKKEHSLMLIKGIALFEKGEFDEGIAVLKNIDRYEYSQPSFFIGQCFYQKECYSESIKEYTKIIDSRSNKYLVTLTFSHAESLLPRLNDYFLRSITSEGTLESALFARAKSYFALHEYEKAEKDLSLYLSRDPKSSLAFYERARVRINLNRLKSASQDFESACEFSPDSHEIWTEWILLEVNQKNTEMLLEIVKRLEAAHPTIVTELKQNYLIKRVFDKFGTSKTEII